MTRERCDHVQRRVLPDADLILRSSGGIAVCRDELVGGKGPDEIADLKKRRII